MGTSCALCFPAPVAFNQDRHQRVVGIKPDTKDLRENEHEQEASGSVGPP